MGKNAESHPDFLTRRREFFLLSGVGGKIAERWATVTPPAEGTS